VQNEVIYHYKIENDQYDVLGQRQRTYFFSFCKLKKKQWNSLFNFVKISVKLVGDKNLKANQAMMIFSKSCIFLK